MRAVDGEEVQEVSQGWGCGRARKVVGLRLVTLRHIPAQQVCVSWNPASPADSQVKHVLLVRGSHGREHAFELPQL